MPDPSNKPPPPEPLERLDAPAIEKIAQRVEEIRARNELLIERMFEGEKRFRNLAKAVWKVQEEERRRLARELHDGIGQTLTALVNQLKRSQPAGGPERRTPGIRCTSPRSRSRTFASCRGSCARRCSTTSG